MYRLYRKSNAGDIYRGFAMSGKMTFGDDFYADFLGRELINGMYVIREANRPDINKRWPRALGIFFLSNQQFVGFRPSTQ